MVNGRQITLYGALLAALAFQSLRPGFVSAALLATVAIFAFVLVAQREVGEQWRRRH